MMWYNIRQLLFPETENVFAELSYALIRLWLTQKLCAENLQEEASVYVNNTPQYERKADRHVST